MYMGQALKTTVKKKRALLAAILKEFFTLRPLILCRRVMTGILGDEVLFRSFSKHFGLFFDFFFLQVSFSTLCFTFGLFFQITIGGKGRL